jgi:hypothetical protein
MKTIFPRLSLAVTLLALVSCERASEPYNPTAFQDPELLHAATHRLTEVMVQTITSPPVASRTYAYSSVAAYEALRPASAEYRTLAGQLNGLSPVPEPDAAQEHLPALAAVYAYLTVARALVFDPAQVEAYRDSLVEQMRERGVPRKVVEHSTDYGTVVAEHILAWANADGLKEARAMPRYEVRQEPGRWAPTPPAYMAGLEPHWGTLRPFVLDSASQFRPPPPHPYDMREGSAFLKQVMEVHEIGRNLTPEQKEIAAFWDCNPFAVRSVGHMVFADKKISPGGHWMGIAALSARKSGADLMRTSEVQARVAITLADAFISVWNEKYRSNLIRPETIIAQHIDPTWRPLLQTPPFPEYTSGHSVSSASAAEVLTDLFGDNFAFDDDVEVPYGLPVRSFASFRQAAEEAAVSRLYGGIHYRMAAEHGLVQGKSVGQLVVERVKTRAPRLANATGSTR